MPRTIKKGEPIDKPRWVKWMGVNGTKESAPLCCPFCAAEFILKRGDPVVIRADCFDGKGVVFRYYIQCPHCWHKSNYDRALVESNAA